MESANIEKIIDLLSDYIREYEEKERYNEILITQSQLYKELLPLIDKDYKILDNNKLFISVLLSAIYNDDSLTNNFYNAMDLYIRELLTFLPSKNSLITEETPDLLLDKYNKKREDYKKIKEKFNEVSYA